MGMVTFFRGLPFHPSDSRIRECPDFVPLVGCDRSTWPWYLAGHGWLATLSSRRVQPPWAVAVANTVDAALEKARGWHPVDLRLRLGPWVGS